MSSQPNSLARKVPPHDMEAEQAVLASVMIDDKALDRIAGYLFPEDFYHPAHALMFRRMSSLAEAGKPLDFITLLSCLNDHNEVDRAGGADYVTSLTQIVPNAANIMAYASTIKNKSMLRKMISVATDISEKAYEHIGDATELVDDAESQIFRMAENRLRSDVASISSLMQGQFEILENLFKRGDDFTGVRTGFIDLDKSTNGLQRSDLIIVAGRPGMGKTAFALNLALNNAYRYKGSVVVFSLEMSSQQLVQRLIASEAEIESGKLRAGSFSSTDWQKIANVGSALSECNIFIDDTPSISAMEVRAKCRRIKREHGLDLVVIDYLQLMGGSKAESREQQISEISRALKALAKELDVPVIALSQLNRGVEARSDKRPVPSDLRESGAIEQDADIIIFLYRDEFYNRESKMPGVAEVIIAKHRNGSTGTIYLAFQGQFTRFRNMEQGFTAPPS